MEVFQNVLNLLKTSMAGLGEMIDWFINFSFDFGGWTFDLFGVHFEFATFHVNSGILLTGGFLGAVVILLIVHLVNVVAG